MHQKEDYQNIDDLMLNLRSILSKYRCSLSEEEKNQLNNVLGYLECSDKNNQLNEIDWSTVFKVLEMLFSVYTNIENVKDFF